MARGGAGAPRRLRGVTDAIPYSIRRSPRARRVSVTVDASTGVEVVLPRRARDREAAAAVRELRLHDACESAGHELRSLSIRGQRTRWASCSPSGAMSFNWRLLLAPEPVLDTVVWHEVCHLDIADHSPRFWALLERRRPDHREHQRWLRRYGALLTL